MVSLRSVSIASILPIKAQGIFGTVVAMMFVFATTCSFFSCSDHDDEPAPVKPDPAYASSRTVMVYMIAENTLYSVVRSDVEEMLSGMRDSTLYDADRLVVYVDGISLPCIYVIDKNTKATSMKELEPVLPDGEVLPYDEDVNSASAEQVGRFVDYVKKNYQAESYGLVLWSHGTGWLPSDYEGDQPASAPRRSFGVDNGENITSNIGHQIEMEDLARELEKRGPMDFLFFDACFMQCVEVCYALRNVAKHIIASPAEIPFPGAYYVDMSKAMFRKDDYAERMLSAYYDYYVLYPSWGMVISDVNTSALPSFADYMKGVLTKHQDALMTLDFSDLLLYYPYGKWTTDFPDFPDMQGVMKKVMSEEEFARWEKEIAKVVTCKYTEMWYSALIVPSSTMKRGGLIPVIPEQCCGVSMFVPREVYDSDPYQYNTAFLNTEWATEVWGF